VLPDYPKVKADLAARLNEFVKKRVDHYLGPLRGIPQVRLFEGDGGRSLTREDGETETGEAVEMRAPLSVASDELPTLTMDALLSKLDEVAKEMARQMAESAYQAVSDAVEKVGNVVDAGGGTLTAELLLESLSAIHIEFRPDGTAQMPEMHIGQSQAEAVRLAIMELETKPKLKQKFAELMEAKWEEWRAREASRKLVG
jgi:hypothetical protein